MENNGKSYSIAGLVLGIVSAVIAWWGIYLSIVALVCGIVGIILAIKGKKMAKEAGAPTGIATAGLVLSIIGTVLAGIGFITCGLCALCAKGVGDALNESGALNDSLNELKDALEASK